MRELTKAPQILLLMLFSAIPFREALAGWFTFAYLTLFAGAVGLAAYVLYHRAERIRIPLPVGLLTVWVLGAVFYASNWDRSFGLFGTWFAAVLVGLAAHELSRGDPGFRFKVCLTLWICASLVAAGNLGLRTDPAELARTIEELPQDEDFKEALLHAATQERFNAPFGNPIHLGLFLALSLLAAPVLYHVSRIQPRPLLMTGALCLTAGIQWVVLWGTKSRTSLLAFAVGILGWFIWYTGRSRRALVGVLSIGLLGAALMLASPTGREMLARVETVSARLIYWEIAARMIRDHPLCGLGVGGYGDYYPMYRGLVTHQTKFPHNFFVEVLTDLGAVGFGLFLFAAMSIGRRAETNVSRYSSQNRPSSTQPQIHDPLETSIAIWRITALIAFFIAAQLDFAYNMPYLVGIIGAITGMGGRIGPAPEPKASRSLAISPFQATGFILLVSFPLALREIGQVQFEQARVAFVEERDYPRAQEKLRWAVRIWPPLAQARHFEASSLRDTGQTRRAENGFREAIAWEPTSAYMREDLADLLWRQGNRDGAMQELEEAIRLHPVKWDYHHRKSLWLQELGNKEDADREKRLAESLKRFEPDYRTARIEQDRGGSKP